MLISLFLIVHFLRWSRDLHHDGHRRNCFHNFWFNQKQRPAKLFHRNTSFFIGFFADPIAESMRNNNGPKLAEMTENVKGKTFVATTNTTQEVAAKNLPQKRFHDTSTVKLIRANARKSSTQQIFTTSKDFNSNASCTSFSIILPNRAGSTTST